MFHPSKASFSSGTCRKKDCWPATSGRWSSVTPSTGEAPEGYEVGFFAATDETVSVASVPSDAVRPATDQDLLRVRVLNRCAK